MRPGSRSSHNSGMNNIDKILTLDHEDVKMGRGRYHSDSSAEQVRIIQNTSRGKYVRFICNTVLRLGITYSIKHFIVSKMDKRNFTKSALGNILQHLANDTNII